MVEVCALRYPSAASLSSSRQGMKRDSVGQSVGWFVGSFVGYVGKLKRGTDHTLYGPTQLNQLKTDSDKIFSIDSFLE